MSYIQISNINFFVGAGSYYFGVEKTNDAVFDPNIAYRVDKSSDNNDWQSVWNADGAIIGGIKTFMNGDWIDFSIPINLPENIPQYYVRIVELPTENVLQALEVFPPLSPIFSTKTGSSITLLVNNFSILPHISKILVRVSSNSSPSNYNPNTINNGIFDLNYDRNLFSFNKNLDTITINGLDSNTFYYFNLMTTFDNGQGGETVFNYLLDVESPLVIKTANSDPSLTSSNLQINSISSNGDVVISKKFNANFNEFDDYLIDTSTDLQNWTTINTIQGKDLTQVTTNLGGTPQDFYIRLVNESEYIYGEALNIFPKYDPTVTPGSNSLTIYGENLTQVSHISKMIIGISTVQNPSSIKGPDYVGSKLYSASFDNSSQANLIIFDNDNIDEITNKTSVTINNLNSDTLYYIFVSPTYKTTDHFFFIHFQMATTTTLSEGVSILTPPVLSSPQFANNKITLNWTNVSGATSYEIYSSTTENGSFTKINGVTFSGNSGLFDQILIGTIYYYVTAKDATNESSPSNTVSFSPTIDQILESTFSGGVGMGVGTVNILQAKETLRQSVASSAVALGSVVVPVQFSNIINLVKQSFYTSETIGSKEVKVVNIPQEFTVPIDLSTVINSVNNLPYFPLKDTDNGLKFKTETVTGNYFEISNIIFDNELISFSLTEKNSSGEIVTSSRTITENDVGTTYSNFRIVMFGGLTIEGEQEEGGGAGAGSDPYITTFSGYTFELPHLNKWWNLFTHKSSDFIVKAHTHNYPKGNYFNEIKISYGKLKVTIDYQKKNITTNSKKTYIGKTKAAIKYSSDGKIKQDTDFDIVSFNHQEFKQVQFLINWRNHYFHPLFQIKPTKNCSGLLMSSEPSKTL